MCSDMQLTECEKCCTKLVYVGLARACPNLCGASTKLHQMQIIYKVWLGCMLVHKLCPPHYAGYIGHVHKPCHRVLAASVDIVTSQYVQQCMDAAKSLKTTVILTAGDFGTVWYAWFQSLNRLLVSPAHGDLFGWDFCKPHCHWHSSTRPLTASEWYVQ